MFRIESCAFKGADANQRPVQEKGVFTDSNWIAQQLQMMVHKSLWAISGIMLNWSQPKFEPKLPQMKCKV